MWLKSMRGRNGTPSSCSRSRTLPGFSSTNFRPFSWKWRTSKRRRFRLDMRRLLSVVLVVATPAGHGRSPVRSAYHRRADMGMPFLWSKLLASRTLFEYADMILGKHPDLFVWVDGDRPVM